MTFGFSMGFRKDVSLYMSLDVTVAVVNTYFHNNTVNHELSGPNRNYNSLGSS